MLNYLSCCEINWNAIGAVATAVAAIVALLVWLVGLRSSYLARGRRIEVNQHLLVEELIRVSSHAVHVWQIVNEPNISPKKISRFAKDVELGLQARRSESLAADAERLPLKFGIALAKFVSATDMLRNSYAIVERSMVYVDGVKVIVSTDSLLILSSISKELIEDSKALAKELEIAAGLSPTSVQKRVRDLSQGEGAG